MSSYLTTVGFDADDTLWHHERFFRITQDRFIDLLSDFTDTTDLADRLSAAERRNLGHYGYGVKGFVLSMIETAIEVTDEKVPASVISELLDAGREMLAHPIELLPHAREAVEQVAATHRVILITKGELLDQERKLAQSGLGDLFDGVEIVSEKVPDTYRRIFDRHGHGPGRSMMVGNSMRSDVIAPIEAGSWGVHVPYQLVWEHERADAPDTEARYRHLPDLSKLSDLVSAIG